LASKYLDADEVIHIADDSEDDSEADSEADSDVGSEADGGSDREGDSEDDSEAGGEPDDEFDEEADGQLGGEVASEFDGEDEADGFDQFQEFRDDEIRDDEIRDDELPDDELPDDELPDDELPDDELTDDELLDDELPDDEFRDIEDNDATLVQPDLSLVRDVHIVSANVCRSTPRLRELLLEMSHCVRKGIPAPKVIGLQDIPEKLPTTGCGDYHVWYHMVKVIPPIEQNSDDGSDDNGFDEELTLLDKVAFYVHKSIASDSWTVDRRNNCMAVLCLTTMSEPIHIINCYNNIYTSDEQARRHPIDYMAELTKECLKLQHTRFIVVGDLNLRHSLWCSTEATPRSISPEANAWASFIVAHSLHMVVPRGTVTYKRMESSGTTIDQVVVSSNLQASVGDYQQLDVKLFTLGNDHIPHRFRLNTELKKDDRIHRNWGLIDNDSGARGMLREEGRTWLHPLGKPPLHDHSAICQYGKDLSAIVYMIEDECVPQIKACDRSNTHLLKAVEKRYIDKLSKMRAEALQRYRKREDEWNRYRVEVAERALLRAEYRERKKQWRNSITLKDTAKAAFKWVKQASKWIKPKPQVHVQPLKVPRHTQGPEATKALLVPDPTVPTPVPRSSSTLSLKSPDYAGFIAIMSADPVTSTSSSTLPQPASRPSVQTTTPATTQPFQDVRGPSTINPSLPPPVPTVDTSTTEYSYVSDPAQQAKIMRDALFPRTSDKEASSKPPLPPPNPARVQHFAYQSCKENEIARHIKHLRKTTPGFDFASNRCFKALGDIVVPYVEHFVNACLKLELHPECFRRAITHIIAKAGKDDYSSPKSYRPIALLSSLGKILERVVASRLRDIAAKHGLLPKMQMGRAGRSTTDALNHVITRIHQGWLSKSKCTLLSLDISGAYDHVDYGKLLQALSDRHVPDWILRFVQTFLTGRSTTLVLSAYQSDPFYIHTGIPQGSPLSPILFLFFAAPLLELFEDSDSLLALGFVDDTCLLARSTSYEENIRILEEAHHKIMQWAAENDVHFSPSKYQCMHFTLDEDGCVLVPNIEGCSAEILKLDELRLLGVMLDSGLTWRAHLKHIEEKLTDRLCALYRLGSSVYGFDVHRRRHLYLSSLLPMINYACPAWYIDAGPYKMEKVHVRRLVEMQKKCLVWVSGAFTKASPRVLQKEMYLDDIQVHLRHRGLIYRARALRDPELCFRPDPYEFVHADADKLVEDTGKSSLFQTLSQPRVLKLFRDAVKVVSQRMRDKENSKLWNKYQREHRRQEPQPMVLHEAWGPKCLEYYRGLTRLQATLLIQCRTGKIGLKGYLISIKQSEDSTCTACGQEDETLEHKFLHCRSLQQQRCWLLSQVKYHVYGRPLDLRTLLTVDAPVAMLWGLQHLNIPMFKWTKDNMV
jgi:hypothetical protein